MLLFILLVVFIAVAVSLAWFLLAHDHGEKEPIGMLWLALGLGFVGAMLAGIIEARVLPVKDLSPGSGLGPLLISTLIVGVVEESLKFVPLSLVLYGKRYFNEHTDGVIYFALAGLGFGLPENILYTLQFGTKAGLGRVVLTPFFHAATTGLIGYFLAKRKLEKRSPAMVIVPLIALMVIHGLYDFGLTAGLWPMTILSIGIAMSLSAGLFMAFMRATDLDQDMGLSVVGHNAFCRSCGFPNPKYHLYCTQCGKNA